MFFPRTYTLNKTSKKKKHHIKHYKSFDINKTKTEKKTQTNAE